MNWIVPILAVITAACGALLAYVVSTRNRPGLKITVGKKDAWLMSGGGSSIVMYIGLVNTGDVPVGISKVGLEFGTLLKHYPVVVDNPEPYKEITKGDEIYKVPVTVADEDKQKLLWAWVKDTTGKQYRSKTHPYIKAD
jgi:hypothetical protein